jgi:transcriptional regulator with XRE-family HTH domain
LGRRSRYRCDALDPDSQLRQEGGLTLAALAAAAGVSTSYLNDIEHDRNVPSLERLSRIADALGLDVRGLLLGVPPFDKGKPVRGQPR